jgi:beta-N-acetylhexosaminidase
LNDTANQGKTMQLEQFNPAQRAGQRLMIGFDGTRFDDRLRIAIDQRKVGGLILFARNLETPDQMTELCRTAQAYARQCGQPPLFIGIDQEGGTVARLKPPFTQFEGARHIRTEAAAAHFARVTARELLSIGVNMNMAPVLDVLPAEGHSVMKERSFGRSPHHVARMGCTIIEQFQRHGLLAVAKHFPGIGRTILDSHEDLPDLETTSDLLAACDVLPFRAAVEAQVAGIMLSHIRYLELDPQWPASLSTAIAHDLLREELGFDGLVLTDDLDMGAIAKHYAPPDIVQQCLNATIDIVLICHESPKIDVFLELILSEQDRQSPLAAEMDASLKRILRAKQQILDPGTT